ncbi:MAG: alpha/beta hydrolase [Ruminococcus sp.]|nr:alpha/beta hydrolase [Ruminococcus sp.]MBE6861124.1 alpha/beta hydrolase [Ruminococcus sp.]
MKRKSKMVLKIVIIVLIELCVLLLIAFINHRIKTESEKSLLEPIGQLVEVEGKNMCVYTEGEGEKTLVFLSGGGTPSPILDFKSLYSQLTEEYKIAVVEKFGYGFSDDNDRSRDIDTMLDDTRKALSKAGVQAPYVLCPHSLSGLEAIYWAQKYPDEVSAIIGLDMAAPEYYTDLNISTNVLKLDQVLCEMGLARLISGSVNILYKNSELTENELSIIKALYSRRCVSDAVVNEGEICKENAKIIRDGAMPKMPVLMFISNGEGINYDKKAWVETSVSYAENLENGGYIKLDCPHYIHNFEHKKIAEEIKRFLGENDE